MNVGSLCAGIGGIEIALESHGHDVVWQCEYDEHASKVLAQHWPTVPNYGDIWNTDWHAVEPIDILAAGYPCQPFSLAGQRQGVTDDRHLWPAIVAAIRVLRPKHLFLENVAGHLSLGFDRVLSDLASLGFDAEWGTVRASDIGAPHSRERLFVLASHFESIGLEKGSESSRSAPALTRLRNNSSFTWGKHESAIQRWESLTRECPTVFDERGWVRPEVREWVMGFPEGWTQGLSRAQRLKTLGNAVCPQQGAWAFRQLTRRLSSPLTR